MFSDAATLLSPEGTVWILCVLRAVAGNYTREHDYGNSFFFYKMPNIVQSLLNMQPSKYNVSLRYT